MDGACPWATIHIGSLRCSRAMLLPNRLVSDDGEKYPASTAPAPYVCGYWNASFALQKPPVEYPVMPQSVPGGSARTCDSTILGTSSPSHVPAAGPLTTSLPSRSRVPSMFIFGRTATKGRTCPAAISASIVSMSPSFLIQVDGVPG